MNDRNGAQARFWIPERDTLGRTIDKELIEAANRVWDRARLTVIRFLGDDSEAAEILEIAVDRTSRKGQSIQCPDAYILRCVARAAIRRFRDRRRIQYLDGAELERVAGKTFMDIEQMLDEAERIETFRACFDERGRKMYDLRILGFSWGEVADLTGYTGGHSAEVQFRKHLDRAVARFRAHRGARVNRGRNGILQ